MRCPCAGRPSRRVVAFGGGHGLPASLSALRLRRRARVDDLTAVVTVADDGGSSGRLRERVRRAAARATCGWRWPPCAATTSGAQTWARVLQHRFAGDGEMRGHAVGNLLIVGALGAARRPRRRARLGRPAARRAPAGCCRWRCVPLDITAEVRGAGPGDPDALDDASAARSRSRPPTGASSRSRSVPADPPACPEALEAIEAADWVVLGPGLVVHLRDPAPAGARRCARPWCSTDARVVVVLNLAPQAGETRGLRPRRPPARCSPSTLPTCGSTPSWPTSASVADELAELEQRRRGVRRRAGRRRRRRAPTAPRATTRSSWPRRTPRSSSDDSGLRPAGVEGC